MLGLSLRERSIAVGLVVYIAGGFGTRLERHRRFDRDRGVLGERERVGPPSPESQVRPAYALRGRWDPVDRRTARGDPALVRNLSAGLSCGQTIDLVDGKRRGLSRRGFRRASDPDDLRTADGLGARLPAAPRVSADTDRAACVRVGRRDLDHDRRRVQRALARAEPESGPPAAGLVSGRRR